MVTMYHSTRAANLPGILKRGLLASKSQGKRKAVWMASRRLIPWGCLHVVKRHGGRIEDTVVLEIDVPRSWLQKHKGGLWYSFKDVPPGRIVRITGFAQIAR